ncbi:MAG: DUF2933 domain-containing protein [Tistlia sp.]
MRNLHRPDHDASPPGGFWRSRSGLFLIAFLVVSGLLLTYEHRVHLLAGEGALVLLLLACIGMHIFMHGGRGGHGDRGGGGAG